MSWGVGAGDTDRKDQHRRASGVGGSPPLGPCFAAAVRHLGYKATPPGTSPDQLEGPLGQCECSGVGRGERVGSRRGSEATGSAHQACPSSRPFPATVLGVSALAFRAAGGGALTPQASSSSGIPFRTPATAPLASPRRKENKASNQGGEEQTRRPVHFSR